MPRQLTSAAQDDGSLLVDTGVCPFCEKPGSVLVPALARDGFTAWQSGGSIQEELPELSDNAREQLMSGIHGACYDEEYPDE